MYKLKDQIQLLWSVDDVVKLHNVGVLQLFEDVDFANDALLALCLHQLELFVHLYRQDHARGLMDSLLDRGIGAGAQVLANTVISDLGVVAGPKLAVLGLALLLHYLVEHLLLHGLHGGVGAGVGVEVGVKLLPGISFPSRFVTGLLYTSFLFFSLQLSLFLNYKKRKT